jgi:hypothetical protein
MLPKKKFPSKQYNDLSQPKMRMSRAINDTMKGLHTCEVPQELQLISS